MIKKIIPRIAVFLAVFILTAFFVNKLNNMNLDNIAKEMTEAKLPVVYLQFEGNVLNRMQGYTQVMSTDLMREGIVPVNEEYGVDILVDDNSLYGKSYYYELRNMAGDILVEDGEIISDQISKGYDKYPIRFRMDLRENQEYMLVFIIENSEGEKARYYTRVVKLANQYAGALIDYAMNFHEATFIKDANDDNPNMAYELLKTSGDAGSYDLSHVDIHSSYEMISWGALNPMVVTGIVPSITEIDHNYAVVKMSYIIEDSSSGNNLYYDVNEYYSMMFDENKQSPVLLGFDRYQESFFDISLINKSRNCISMGITDANNVKYVSSDSNKKLTFVKQGELWYYDYTTGNVTSIFSFSHGKYSDVRLTTNNVDINIASMDDEGNIYFVVYGYMCRGVHEGKNGISLYYYNAGDSKIEEKLFVSCDEPFDVMRQEIGRFAYYDENGYFYYLLDGAIYKVDFSDMSQSTINFGLMSDKYVVSENRKIVAYPNDNNPENTTKIIIRNFETGNEYEISGNDTDRYLALGFVGNDLICGVAKRDDIIISSDKEAIMPMYKLFIEEPGGNVIKEYSKPDVYIMKAKVGDDRIYLERAKRLNNFFENAEPDFISYKHDNNELGIVTSYAYDTNMMNVLDVVFPSNLYIDESSRSIMTKTKESENYTEFLVETYTNPTSFYIFGDRGYEGEFRSAGSAILAVNEKKSGLVVDANGNTVYRALEADGYNTVAEQIKHVNCQTVYDSLFACAYMCIEYIDSRVEYEDVISCSSWEEAFEKNTLGVGVDISGIDLQTALFFLDRDVPFAACIDDGRYVLVISYNSTHIRYYDPMLGEEVKVTRNEFEDSLSKQSNKMYTYTSQ